MPDETISEKLATYISSRQFKDIPSGVVDAAKLHILDALGCLLAGTRLEPGKLAYELALAASQAGFPSASTLFGSAERAVYSEAIQAMSVAAHCGEMDDIHAGAGTCIGAVIVPALLAMAERNDGSGTRFLEAAIAGYETIIRVGLCIDAPKLFARGWWPSTICGAFGVAAAGAKFLSFSLEKTVHALGIAALHAGGMITGGNEGATARHLAFGHAAQNGVLALLAAERGFSGPKRVFEDPRGFCLTLSSEPKWEILQSFDGYYLPEVAFKPYPCARQLHAGVEALLKIIGQGSLTPAMIGEIELFLPAQNAVMMDHPTMTASHAATVGSGQYVMAVTMIKGRIDLASFDRKFLQSVEVHDLMRKVKVSPSADLDRHYPKYWPGRVALRLSDGRSYSEEVIIPKGESGNSMTAREVEEKFLFLAASILGEEKARSVMREVYMLDARESLSSLFDALEVPTNFLPALTGEG